MSLNGRIDRLEQQANIADDDLIVIIRWGLGDDIDSLPIVYTRNQNGQVIKRVGYSTIPNHLQGERIILDWGD